MPLLHECLKKSRWQKEKEIMPLPRPKPREKQNSFISRCMKSKVMKREFKTVKQRLAVCFSLYNSKKKRK